MSRIDNHPPRPLKSPSDVGSTNEPKQQRADNPRPIDRWQSPPNAHGCPACPHPTVGLRIDESPNLLINSQPARTLKNLKE